MIVLLKIFSKLKRFGGRAASFKLANLFFFSRLARLFLSFNFFKLTKVFREGFSVLTVGVNFCEGG